VGQLAEDVAVEIGFENIHVRIEIPFVAAADAGLFVLFLLLAFGGLRFVELGIEMARRKDDAFAIRAEIAASRAAAAGADKLGANRQWKITLRRWSLSDHAFGAVPGAIYI